MEPRPPVQARQTASGRSCLATEAESSVPTEALVAPAPGNLEDRTLKDLVFRSTSAHLIPGGTRG